MVNISVIVLVSLVRSPVGIDPRPLLRWILVRLTADVCQLLVWLKTDITAYFHVLW